MQSLDYGFRATLFSRAFSNPDPGNEKLGHCWAFVGLALVETYSIENGEETICHLLA